MDLSTKTPSEIDTVLARIWKQKSPLLHDLLHYGEIAKSRELRPYEAEYLEKSKAKLQELVKEEKPYNDEYIRRRWRRYFLVTNGNGHVHRERHCPTCFATTLYAWLPELSGCDEKEAVAEYGEKMCSVCFPDAPTIAKLMGPSKFAQAEAAKKLAREEKRAEKARIAAQKGIANPDGTPLKIDGWVIKTVVSAKQALNRQVEIIEMMTRRPEQHTYRKEEREQFAHKAIQLASEALAAKLGGAPEEYVAHAKKLAAKKMKQWGW